MKLNTNFHVEEKRLEEVENEIRKITNKLPFDPASFLQYSFELQYIVDDYDPNNLVKTVKSIWVRFTTTYYNHDYIKAAIDDIAYILSKHFGKVFLYDMKTCMMVEISEIKNNYL